jgi:hypothetical protein
MPEAKPLCSFWASDESADASALNQGGMHKRVWPLASLSGLGE